MIASVLLEIKAKSIDKTFDYLIPERLQETLKVGMRVLIPFGSQKLEGYVLKITKDSNSEYELKEIIQQIDSEVVLNQELLFLGKKMQEETLCSLSNAYSTMLPIGIKAKEKQNMKEQYESYLRLNVSLDKAYVNCKNTVQTEIINLFESNILLLKKEANEISLSAVKTLIKNGVITEEKQEKYRYQIEEEQKDIEKNLTKEQQQAKEKIINLLNTPETILLHGVTGSGKTEIYMQIISEVLKQNKTSLVLVPEISLTPQLIQNFTKRFGSNIAVLHSGLSDGEKYDEWRKINRGEVNIVIGARSATFAPLKNLGIIIIDECHSESYKQENRPKYHAIKMAQIRSEYHKCPIILGSATPSLEIMARAQKGVFSYIELKKRVNQGHLPETILVDMKKEAKKGRVFLSQALEEKITERLTKKEQVMILLNRRGHSTTVTCSSCGFTYRCPYCDITLTYHKTNHSLRCHYCGYTKYIDKICPNCHENALNYYGLGTEKLEAILKEKFKEANIIRVDTDTTSKKDSLKKIMESFQNQEYNILIGTQMISKGLDFPNVTLVGIINADMTLNLPDFRSSEKTFSLLCQASGRSGRSHLKGEVILETYNPENHILKFVQKQDYSQFYQYEMNIRKKLKYPPYYYLAHLVIKSKDYEQVRQEANKAASFLKKHLDSTSILLGPTPASMFRVNNIYHFEMMIKYRFDKNLKNTLKELDQIFLLNKKVELDIDLNY